MHSTQGIREQTHLLPGTAGSLLERLGLALEDGSAVFAGTGLGKAKWPQRTQGAGGEGET